MDKKIDGQAPQKSFLGSIFGMSNPWGNGNGGGDGNGGGPRNPWGNPSGGSSGGGGRKGGATSLEELFKKGTGGGFKGGIPKRPGGRSWWPIFILGFIILWVALTSIHRVSPQERGVVTFFGSYSRTMQPGLHFSLPAPLEQVSKLDVEEIRTIDIPTGESEKLILTGDQNIVDLAYSVRWNIKAAELFLFQIAEPEETIKEVAEASMRAAVANFTLDDTIGSERTEIEQQVQTTMQALLDGYGAGVVIRGIAIKKADPPAAVNDAFKEVSASQQTAQTFLNEARAYAQQLTAQAQGESAAFDKVYEEYRLAPRVTRQRMYYETMERVLSEVDKTIVEPSGVTPYLALPELKKRAEAAPAGDGQ
ncbi:protease FtsH subunit HflK [Parasphingorhabdus marina DSM 22363]|uniref:Protease FtsH subunit HflK n=1 Tax=Parasphingorhabdus marina DSM 22363 TaxID=1123272 RepID=A0A1N6CYI3_9SPHN|nr:protease FtsH subunit HflK [Parasphingorhabdus marina DSM 22363]